ncbi:MAG: PepSY domain-containing protein [Litorimonas sp.]
MTAILSAAPCVYAAVDIHPNNPSITTGKSFLSPKVITTSPRSKDKRIIRLTQKKISASKAKKIARSRVKKGEVVDIYLNGNTYKVRVIAKNGRVVDVLIDANTGRIK